MDSTIEQVFQQTRPNDGYLVNFVNNTLIAYTLS